MAFTERPPSPLPTPSAIPATPDGLVLPPFPPRPRNPPSGPTRALPGEMTAPEARVACEGILSLLDGFTE